MKNAGRVFVVLVVLVWTVLLSAQSTPAEPEATRSDARDPGGIGPGLSVPRLIKFGGALKTPSGSPLTGVHGVTLALYKEQEGGAPVWMESQNVELDSQGRYTILLGSTKSAGVPLELFTADEPRWLGIQVQLPGYQEEARVLLVSVPYALKAADAERLGGKPLSAFVMVPEEALKSGGAGQISDRTPGVVHAGRAISLPTAAVTTANYIAMFLDGAGTTGNSTIYQSGNNVGIGTTSPQSVLHIAGTVPGILMQDGAAVDKTNIQTIQGSMYINSNVYYTGTQFFSFNTANPAWYLVFGNGTGAGDGVTIHRAAASAGPLSFTEMFRVNANGNIGVGTASPAQKLHVLSTGNVANFDSSYAGGGGAGIFLRQTGASAPANHGRYIFFNFQDTTTASLNTAWLAAVTESAAGAGSVPTAMVFNTGSTNGPAERLRITSAGNVGIGTATPAAKLDVAGSVNASGSVTAASLSGSGTGLTSLNASNLSSGTVANARTTATPVNTANTIVSRDGSGNFIAGTITATAFVGGGGLITGVNAASLNGVAATNYARTDVANNLTGTQAITGPVSVRSSSTVEQLNMDTSGNLVALGSLYVGQGNFVTPTGTDVVLGQVTNGSTISNVFRVDSTGKGYFNGGTQTGGADFAESFEVAGSRSGYEPGDVLVIDPSGRRRMALSTSAYSTRVSGIHSTKPGVLATPYEIDNNGNIANEVPLAVIGVVPCKVSAENGAIAVGDLLVTSSTPGHAMRGSNRKKMLGAVVGKALEPLASGKGVIQVLVTLQ